jgi:hypothetical protein
VKEAIEARGGRIAVLLIWNAIPIGVGGRHGGIGKPIEIVVLPCGSSRTPAGLKRIGTYGGDIPSTIQGDRSSSFGGHGAEIDEVASLVIRVARRST